MSGSDRDGAAWVTVTATYFGDNGHVIGFGHMVVDFPLEEDQIRKAVRAHWQPNAARCAILAMWNTAAPDGLVKYLFNAD